MITPLFKVDQDEKFLYLKIKVKYVKFSEVDFFIENNNFRFYLKPYHLNLYFSDNLKNESENNHSKYDVDKELIECRIEKEIEGCKFKNLELISTLLFENKINNEKSNFNWDVKKKVEEVGDSITINSNNKNKSYTNINPNSNYPSLSDEILHDPDLFNEFLLNSIFNDLTKNFENFTISSNKDDTRRFGYGFNNEFIDVFKQREEERIELLDLDTSAVEVKHRYFSKMEREMGDFIPERYVYDELVLEKEDEEYLKMLNRNLKLKEKIFNSNNKNEEQENIFNFLEKELNILKSINKTKLSIIDSDTNIHFEFYLQAIDILFSVLYDYRTTEFEHNSESGWTVNKISSVFSCCVDFKKNYFSFSEEPPFNYLEEAVRNVLISCYRRVLCYPLYRNTKICKRIKEDLSEILSKGIFQILKILLRARILFERSEPRHILNKLYVDSFIKWVQFYSIEKIWIMLGKFINTIQIAKHDLKLGLEEYEDEFQLDYNEMDSC